MPDSEDYSPPSLRKLVERARDGDRGALEELLTLLRPDLERFARRYSDASSASQSTSDLVQEAWLRAWKGIERFEGSTDDEANERLFRAWIARIVHRTGLNQIRDRRAQRRRPRRGFVAIGAGGTKTRQRQEIPADTASPSERSSVSEEARAVRDALASLADAIDREVVRLRFFEGMTLGDIARQLDLSYDQARERYRKSLRVLERKLGRLE